MPPSPPPRPPPRPPSPPPASFYGAATAFINSPLKDPVTGIITAPASNRVPVGAAQRVPQAWGRRAGSAQQGMALDALALLSSAAPPTSCDCLLLSAPPRTRCSARGCRPFHTHQPPALPPGLPPPALPALQITATCTVAGKYALVMEDNWPAQVTSGEGAEALHRQASTAGRSACQRAAPLQVCQDCPCDGPRPPLLFMDALLPALLCPASLHASLHTIPGVRCPPPCPCSPQLLACGRPAGSDYCRDTDYDPDVDTINPSEHVSVSQVALRLDRRISPTRQGASQPYLPESAEPQWAPPRAAAQEAAGVAKPSFAPRALATMWQRASRLPSLSRTLNIFHLCPLPMLPCS